MNAQMPKPQAAAIIAAPVNDRPTPKRIFPIVIVGHVDHGKSTLIGRLLHDTGAVEPDKLRELTAAAAKRGRPVEWSFLLDALEIERDQGITLDTSRIWFSSAVRPYVIIDAPGHHELVRNMLTGAASAEAAILVVDATHGLGAQTRRHANLLSLLGISQVLVAINKIDMIDHDSNRFSALAREVEDYLARLNFKPSAIVPVSARNGDNIASLSALTPWYQGASLLSALDQLAPRAPSNDGPTRFLVQDIWFRDNVRIVVGRLAAGRIRVGDELTFAPSGGRAKVLDLPQWGASKPLTEVGAGMSVAITLDDQILLERGHIGYQQDQAPLIGRRLDLRLIWLDADALTLGEKLNLRLGTQELEARVDAIHDVMDLETLVPEIARTVPQNAIARITVSTRKPLTADPNDPLSPTGRAVLARGHRVVAGALVTNLSDHASDNLTAVTSAVSAVERRRVNGHAGGVLWLTGLSGSGKSTLAIALEAALMARGWRAFVLDGDNLRRGLNSDLDFSPAARAENMRRAAEVAKLMSDSGLVTIVSLISPYQAERARAKRIIGDGFREIHIAADLATCIARDPKGLYARARQGLIRDFTGIDSPYEAPTNPDLVIDTGAKAFADNLSALLNYALSQFDLDARRISTANLGDGI